MTTNPGASPEALLRGRFFFFVLCLLLPAGGGVAASEPVSITILHTTDVRGHVLSLRYREWRRHEGGLLRCSSLVKSIRREGAPVLLLDCGDLLSGSPEGLLTDGRLPLEAVNWMGYDARILGGDDWRGLSGSGEREAHTTIPLLGANLVIDDGAGHLRLNHRRWLKKEVAGVRIALVGLASPPATGMSSEEEVRVRWLPPDRALAEVLKEVRRWRPDILLLAAHYAAGTGRQGGASPLVGLLRRYPEFDIALGGGDGSVVREARTGRTVVAQAGRHGKWLGRIDVDVDPAGGGVWRCRSDVVPVTSAIEEDPRLRQALGARLGRIERQLEEVLGHTVAAIGGAERWPGQSAGGALLAAALREHTGTDAVLWGGDPAGHLHAGDIRYGDILRVVPPVRGWHRMSIPAIQLRRVLEENAALRGTADFWGLYGVTCDYYPGEDDPVRRLLLPDGTPPHGRRRLDVLFPAGALQRGAEGRRVLRSVALEPAARLRRLELDPPELVAAYVRRHSPLQIKPERGMRWRGESP